MAPARPYGSDRAQIFFGDAPRPGATFGSDGRRHLSLDVAPDSENRFFRRRATRSGPRKKNLAGPNFDLSIPLDAGGKRARFFTKKLNEPPKFFS
jgi:hypothetical protein